MKRLDAHPLAGRPVLVTGATGFIGARLLVRLRAIGVEAHALSRVREAGEHDGVRWWRIDLGDADAVADLVNATEPDTLFHLAGHVSGVPAPELVVPTVRSNVVGTVNVLEAARRRGCRRVVVAGSMVEPGAGPDPVPGSPYAASKWAGSGYARMFHALWDVPAVILRIFMVYGPHQPDLRKLVPHVVVSLLRGERPRVSSGALDVDWVYVDDVVEAFLAAARGPALEGRTIDVGSGELVSIRGLVERLVELVGAEVEPDFGAMDDRPLERPRVADVEAAAARAGWRPAVGLDEGLRRTVEWYRERLPELSSPR